MTIDQLNARFGAPGRIVFHEGFAGYPEVVIANKYGAAEIALLGGNVLSYRPTGHFPVIFRPAKRDYNRGESFHGGIPVCWPQFGNKFSKDLPQHGFAKLLVFDVRGTEYSEDMTEITLGLKSNEETMKMWPHKFDLEFKVSVSMKLNLKLTTTNKDETPFDFSCGFHPYFRVSHRDNATIAGTSGLDFFNGVDGNPNDHQTHDLVMDHATDHIFRLPLADLKHEFAILDNKLKRGIALVSSGNTKLVIWNPGEGATMKDFESDDWSKFVCVEPVSNWPEGQSLQPGEKYVLTAAIQSNAESLH
ncbi:MAG: D-hexose-6-phosphate mutarotase [Kiritimatiellae bacterium]|nr:D-hexose-6-phosphate mutarotase [Kiritimatiellia bacterium]